MPKILTKESILLVILTLATVSLRLISLGYSDYISDEPGTFFYRGGDQDKYLSRSEFLLKQRKGPLQVIIGYISYSIIGTYNNEFAQRLPFTLFSIGAIIVFYKLVIRLTSSIFIAFTSALLLSTNGLIVGYGRIAQYQNLNLFFSIASLYFFTYLRSEKSNHFKMTLLGSLMFCLSFLSHWDAVYILIPIGILYFEFLLNKEFETKHKILLTLANILLVFTVLAPFMISYIKYQLGSVSNINYLDSIVGFGGPFSERPDLNQFLLYNPFITFWFYIIAGILGLTAFKENYLIAIWAITILVIFRFFISYSGLHFYNVFIPVVILCGIGINQIIKLFPKFGSSTLLLAFTRKMKPFIIFSSSILFVFFYYQSYLLFVDHTIEYPMESENILGMRTKVIEHSDNLRHRTGFPHKRYWKEINKFINEQNRLNNENLGYFTNEIRIDEFYMDANKVDAGTSETFYAIGVKRPLSLQHDYKLPQIKGKHTVHEIVNENNVTVVKIYRKNN